MSVDSLHLSGVRDGQSALSVDSLHPSGVRDGQSGGGTPAGPRAVGDSTEEEEVPP